MPVFIVYFALLAVAFFFLIVRPQRRQLAARRALIQAVEVGDEIITAGGIYGVVLSIEDDTMQVEIAPGVVMTLAREAVARRRDDVAVDARHDRPRRVRTARRPDRRDAGGLTRVRRSFWYLTITVVLIVGTFVLTLAGGSSPVLGLDLQGGIEVRLEQVGKQRPNAVRRQGRRHHPQPRQRPRRRRDRGQA